MESELMDSQLLAAPTVPSTIKSQLEQTRTGRDGARDFPAQPPPTPHTHRLQCRFGVCFLRSQHPPRQPSLLRPPWRPPALPPPPPLRPRGKSSCPVTPLLPPRPARLPAVAPTRSSAPRSRTSSRNSRRSWACELSRLCLCARASAAALLISHPRPLAFPHRLHLSRFASRFLFVCTPTLFSHDQHCAQIQKQQPIVSVFFSSIRSACWALAQANN